jgi:hypothetical protein
MRNRLKKIDFKPKIFPRACQKSKLVQVKISISKVSFHKWSGCIYFSQGSSTSEYVSILKNALKFLKHGYMTNPVFLCTANSRTALQTMIDQKISELIMMN